MKKLLVGCLLLMMTSMSFAQDIEVSGGMTDSDFKDFALELGSAIAFSPMAPAEPLGITGFDVSLEATVADISDGERYWENMSKDGDPSSFLMFTKLHAMKGLPYNIDIGAMVGSVANSNVQAWGLEIRYAILEGTAATPALGVRGTYSQMTGVSDVKLEQYSGDLLISKGILMFTPYAGVSVFKLLAKETSDDIDTDTVDEYQFKGLAGIQVTPFPLLSIKAEGVVGGAVPQYNLSVGVKF